MDPTSDAEFLRYFHDRQAWLLEPEARRFVRLPRDAAALVSSGSISHIERIERGGDVSN
jgi:hypothetical protein